MYSIMIIKFISSLVQFIMATTKYKSLDESHGIIHSFNTLHYAQNIFEHEKYVAPVYISDARRSLQT